MEREPEQQVNSPIQQAVQYYLHWNRQPGWLALHPLQGWDQLQHKPGQGEFILLSPSNVLLAQKGLLGSAPSKEVAQSSLELS